MRTIARRWQWLQALRDPAQALAWDLAEWERVVRLARRLRLLARLAESLQAAGLTDAVPPQPARLLLAERRSSQHRSMVIRWAATRIAAVLADHARPIVLLKGCAYMAQGLPIAAGRLPSDLDMLVPKSTLASVQQTLVQAGWQEAELDAYDRRYYAEWSHEVPPMRHDIHPVELDLHHDILPPVARTRVDIALMLRRCRPSGWPHWSVFAPVDQVLHSAAHLFLDAEPVERIRDLVDLDGMMRHFGSCETGFWDELPRRAAELGLVEPLALACHFCTRWLGTPVPDDAAAAMQETRLGWLRRGWLVPLFDAVLTPAEPDAEIALRQRASATLVLARYHLQRMPLHLLLPHLWRKANSRRHDDSVDGF